MTSVETMVRSLCAHFGSCEPETLCRHLGISVVFADLPAVTRGFYYKACENQIILIHQALSLADARVTLGHELGHALLHGDMNYLFMTHSTNMVVGRYEREADYFCACLLINGILHDGELTASSLTAEQCAKTAGMPEELARLWLSRHGR